MRPESQKFHVVFSGKPGMMRVLSFLFIHSGLFTHTRTRQWWKRNEGCFPFRDCYNLANSNAYSCVFPSYMSCGWSGPVSTLPAHIFLFSSHPKCENHRPHFLLCSLTSSAYSPSFSWWLPASVTTAGLLSPGPTFLQSSWVGTVQYICQSSQSAHAWVAPWSRDICVIILKSPTADLFLSAFLILLFVHPLPIPARQSHMKFMGNGDGGRQFPGGSSWVTPILHWPLVFVVP